MNAGISSAGFMAALDTLNKEQGYTIDYPIVDSSELVTQGVASGQFAFRPEEFAWGDPWTLGTLFDPAHLPALVAATVFTMLPFVNGTSGSAANVAIIQGWTLQ